MEENSDEIKLETMELDGFMEEINDIAPVYVQEGFMSDSEEEPRTRQGSRMPKPFEMEMKNMKRRVRDLESEVGALRSELRLVKRKFREVVDPSQDRYREVIQQVVAETLDNQCYWKTIRFDPRVSGANAKRKSLDSNHSPQRRKSFKGNSSDSIGDSDEYRRIDTDDDDEIARKQQQRNPGARKDTQSWRILHGAQSANKNVTGPQKPDLKYREDPKKLKSGESKQPPKNIESKVVVVRKETGNTGGTTGRDVPAKDNWQGKNSGTKRGSGGGDEPNSSVDRSHQQVRKIEKEDESDGDMDGTHQCDRKNSYTKDPDFKIKELNETDKDAGQKTCRKSYTAAFKIQVCKRAEQIGNRKAGTEFGVGEACIRGWRKMLPVLLKLDSDRKSLRGKSAKFPELERELRHWIDDNRSKHVEVSMTAIRLQAELIAQSRNIQGFNPSKSWCERFMKRGENVENINTTEEPDPEEPDELEDVDVDVDDGAGSVHSDRSMDEFSNPEIHG